MNVIEELKRGKKFQTKDGRDVRIFCTDLKNIDYRIIGAVTEASGGEQVMSWTINGLFQLGEENDDDLVVIPEQLFIVIHDDGHLQGRYLTEKAAKEALSKHGDFYKHKIFECKEI